MQILPPTQIFRSIQANVASFLANAGGDAQIPRIAVAPKKWIAETGNSRILRRLDDRGFPFRPRPQLRIARRSKANRFTKIVNAVAQRSPLRCHRLHAGVKDGRDAVVLHGAAGEAAIRIIPSPCRRKRNRQMPPVNHVVAHRMRPMHIAPNRRVRVVLEKHVVVALPVDRAVRIVHPIFSRQEMKLGTQRISGKASAQSVFILGISAP